MWIPVWGVRWNKYVSVSHAIIGSDNVPSWNYGFIWTNAVLLFIRSNETYFNETLYEILIFHSRKRIENVCKIADFFLASIYFHQQKNP